MTIYCRRCEGTNVSRYEAEIGTPDGDGWYISQTCQDCGWLTILRDDAHPENEGVEKPSPVAIRQHDGTLWYI